MMTEDLRPPIPASCAGRPVVGGLVAPYVNLRLADGGVDFRSPHHAKYEECWTRELCQTCGQQLTHPAVLFGGPNQLRTLHFDEPPLCPPCAVYASRACPMIAGRRERYADRPRVSEGARGHVCSDAGCECGGWTPTDPANPDSGGDPAHPWYACYVRPGAWQLTGKQIVARCTDLGCEHERLIVNGAILNAVPLKILLIAEPGTGRIWRKLAAAEAAGHAARALAAAGQEAP
jgi:hypothetical protein